MTLTRVNIVDLDATPYIHFIYQCVRRAFLGAIFAVDVCAYAALSTHFHVALHVMTHLVQQWSDEEVLRWVGWLCPSTEVMRPRTHGVEPYLMIWLPI